jgi:hypothetical protein
LPHTISLIAGTAAPVDPPTPVVTSCSDYVFKKFYDYAVFEDSARTCGNNMECVYGKAVNLPGGPLGTKTLYAMMDPSRGPVRIEPQLTVPGLGMGPRPRNGFYEVPPSEVLGHARGLDPAKVSALLSEIGASNTYNAADLWAWSVWMHDRQIADNLADDERLDIVHRMDAYRLEEASLRALQAAQTHPLGGGCGNVVAVPGSDEDPNTNGNVDRGGGGTPSPSGGGGTCQDPDPGYIIEHIQMTYDQMGRDLLAEFERTGHGCLSGTSARCDWSPRRFANEYVGRYAALEQQAYDRCMNATGGGLWVNGYGPPLADRIDGIALEAYFDRAFAQMEEEARELPWMETGGTPVDTTLRIQGPHGSNGVGVPDVLRGDFDYDLWWELAGHTTNETTPRLCKLDSAVHGHLKATFTAPESGELLSVEVDKLPGAIRMPTHTVADVEFDASLNRDHWFAAKGHFTILDATLPGFDFANDGDPVFEPPAVERTAHVYEYEEYATIFGIPVFVDLSIKATAGYNLKVEGHALPQGQCNAPVTSINTLSGSETLTFTPFANVHATGKAGIGIDSVLSVGVQGDVDVVTAHAPLTQTMNVVPAQDPLQAVFHASIGLHPDADLMNGSLSLYAELAWEKVDQEIVSWPPVHLGGGVDKSIDIRFQVLKSQFDKGHELAH